MRQFSFSTNLKLDLDVTGLTERHKRLIKTLNAQIIEILKCEQEGEYFKSTEEAVKTIANIVKQAQFQSFCMEEEPIPYAEQALEAAFDNVRDSVYGAELEVFDN